MVLWVEPITNRQKSDVDRVKEFLDKGWDNLTEDEQSEFLDGMIGAFNYTDIERIENNVQLLSDIFELDLITRVDDIPEHPTREYFEGLLSNVGVIREIWSRYINTPILPDSNVNTYSKVNDIEKILLDVYSIIIAQFNYYCGEIYSGDEFGLLL